MERANTTVHHSSIHLSLSVQVPFIVVGLNNTSAAHLARGLPPIQDEGMSMHLCQVFNIFCKVEEVNRFSDSGIVF